MAYRQFRSILICFAASRSIQFGKVSHPSSIKQAGLQLTKNMKRIPSSKYLALGASLALVLMAQTSRAQIGSGWSSLSLDKAHDFDGGSYSDSSGIETFKLPSSGHRMEIRLKPDYGDGQRQFEGYVKVTGQVRSAGASITQVYQHGVGMEHQTRINSSGDMYTLPGHDPLDSNIFGVWIRVNVAHSIPSQNVKTYINGSWKSTQTYLDENETYMTKYGIYLEPDSGTTTVQWKSIRLWHKS